MRYQIQDDIIRRCLDFFGLRGPIDHEYEATVTPVVLVGDLSQPTIARRFAAITDGNPLVTVPDGECWELISLTASHTQAGGAVAAHLLLIAQLPEPINIYRFIGITDIAASVPSLRVITTLNATNFCTWNFPARTTVSSNTRIFTANYQGDGTLTMTGVVVYRKLGERLLEIL